VSADRHPAADLSAAWQAVSPGTPESAPATAWIHDFKHEFNFEAVLQHGPAMLTSRLTDRLRTVSRSDWPAAISARRGTANAQSAI
jgi:hypothetical protein